MKQNISWQDFISLEYNQVIKLQKLINQKYHTIDSEKQWEEIKNYKHTFVDGTETNIHTSYLGFLEKCNIGKMIEILQDNKCDITYDFNPALLTGELIVNGHCRHRIELCNALWEAVKSVLSEDKRN